MIRSKWVTHYFYMDEGDELELSIDVEVDASNRVEAEALVLEQCTRNHEKFVGWKNEDTNRKVGNPIWKVWRRPAFEDIEWAVARYRHAMDKYFEREQTTKGSGEHLLDNARVHLDTVLDAHHNHTYTCFSSNTPGQAFHVAVVAVELAKLLEDEPLTGKVADLVDEIIRVG